MKTRAPASCLILLLLHTVGLTTATNLHVVNHAGTTLCVKYWVPNGEVGGGCKELAAEQAWDVGASPKLWESATMWAIPGGCAGQACNTGPPSGVTQFEITVGGFAGNDFYDVSMKGGFNMGIKVVPTNADCTSQACSKPEECQGAIPNGPDRTLACPYGSTDYIIIFYYY